MSFKEIPVQEVQLNPMTLIGEQWWLIAAGNRENGYNAMTAAWGHLRSIWERRKEKGRIVLPTAMVYVRPQHYTKEFLDREELFTLSVLDESDKKTLLYMGTHSGREEDKAAKAGLTPLFVEGTICFAETEMVFVCRKLYQAPLVESGFVDKSLVESNYPDKGFHEMYVGEIIKVLVKT